jgi:large subunit ribosomal protein L4
MKVTLYNQKAETIGEIELNPKIFEVKPSIHLLAEAVRVSQNNSRQGTSNTKTRGEVRGGGKKPWKQKGTGRARVGSIRSPIWRKGGITFGPRANRNWELKMNKKAKTKALFMSLSDKAAEKHFFVIDQIVLEKGKTREFVDVIKSFKDLGKHPLFVLPKKDNNLMRSSRNLPGVTSALASNLNIVDVMKADTIVALKDSLGVIEKHFLKSR